MEFQWKQLGSSEKELHKWALIHKDTGRTVLVLGLSPHAETKWNWKLRKKIQRAYAKYHNLVWFNKLRFF